MSEEIATLRAELAALQAKVQQHDDVLALIRLQSAYGYYVDKTQYDEAADLFATDATLEIAGRGLFRGQERIRQYLHALPKLQQGTVFNHMQLQPVNHVAADGRTAKARWRTLMQVGQLGKEARWGEATYENAYVKEGGVWKIQMLHGYITFYVEFDQGWNKGAVPLPQNLEGLAPDAPPTVKYGAFPEVFLPPYHYKNPVTGK